ncbi:MAG: MBL fold metallo-hydrolase [Candidatus Diapherotrites archaeon]|nr:MBL fold metallo-hydrolase [Candidatus Diapherotrites archaeon]
MRIRFLGSGGGRYVTAYQLRRTGGFLVEDRLLVHVDPGPGAARALRDFGEDVRKIDAVLVSHNHPDHVIDAPVVVEGLTRGTKERRGSVLAARSVIEGWEDFRVLSPYHQRLVERVVPLEPGTSAELGSLKVKAIKAIHTEPGAVGLVLEGSRTLTYYSDTGYWEGMEQFARDIVIFNLEVLHELPTHTHPGVVKRVLERSSPKLLFFTHFGMGVLRFGPERLGKMIEREFGVDVIVVEDGLEWRKGKDVTLFDF